jgi:uncharacterized repeat protein (TIGR03803 family)
VFSVTRTGHEKVLYSFKGGSDGATPVSGLVASGGLLYGTTETGGSSTCTLSTAGCGIVFSLTKGGAEKILYRFGGADGAMPRAGLLISNGTIYGTTYSGGSKSAGTVFALAKSGTERVLHSFGNGQDGQGPNAGLSSAGGVFYGTTAGGGNSYGTVFQISRSGAERVIYRFKPSQDGRYPRASVLPQNDVLFGTTENGGTGGSDDGIAFRVSP